MGQNLTTQKKAHGQNRKRKYNFSYTQSHILEPNTGGFATLSSLFISIFLFKHAAMLRAYDKQESLADAKVRPLAKKSAANLQLMVNNNHSRITYGLRIAGYFRV